MYTDANQECIYKQSYTHMKWKVTMGDKHLHTLMYTDDNQECIHKQSYTHLKKRLP